MSVTRHEHPFEPLIADPNPPIPDLVTPTLCASVYLDPAVCRHVTDSFVDDGYRAWGPCQGLDCVAVLRHALAARRITLGRDIGMLVIAFDAVALAAAQVLSRWVSIRDSTVLGVVVAGVLIGAVAAARSTAVVEALSTAATWLSTTTRRLLARPAPTGEDRRGTSRVVPLTLLAASTAVAGIAWSDPSALLPLVAGVVLVWVIWVGEVEYRRLHAVRILRGSAPVRDLAPALRPATEARLAGLAEANVIVSSAKRMYPFVGAGLHIDRGRLQIDVLVGRKDADGTRAEPSPVRIEELRTFLQAMFELDRSATFWSGHRIYAEGGQWSRTSAGLPSHTLTPDEMLAATTPRHELYERVYFCLQETARGGDLVATLLVRPYLQDTHLVVEIELYALLPLRRAIVTAVATLPPDRLGGWWRAVTSGSRSLLSEALDSPVRCAEHGARVFGRCRQRFSARRAMRLQSWFDCGADRSLRDLVSLRDPVQLTQYECDDLVRITSLLNNRLLRRIKEFLDDKGIDTTEFEKRSNEIVQTIQQWNVGQIKANMVSLGNENSQNGRAGSDADPTSTSTEGES